MKLIIFCVIIFLGYSCSIKTHQELERTVILQDSISNNIDTIHCFSAYIIQNEEGAFNIEIAEGCIEKKTLYLKEKDSLERGSSLMDLAETASETGDYEYDFKEVKVNGQPFTGTIMGYDRSLDRNKLIKIQLKKGLRFGRLKIWQPPVLKVHYFYEYNRRVHVFKGPAPLVVVTKPIIYLYPEKSCEVIVKLDYKNNLTILYPKFNIENGWTIKAQPDGRLIDPTTQKEYYGLYWEGDSDKVFDLSTGFVVKGEKSADFLDKKLAQLGLSRREANEFIVYWLPRMEKNKYNLIHFAQEEYRSLAQLKISPKPQTLIRVFMVLQPLDKTINVPQQDLPTIERKGFTVVEWGGTEYPKRREYE